MVLGGQELRQKLTAVRGNHIISGMCDMWQGRSIRVPRLRPTLQGCDIIKVDYALMVSCHVTRNLKQSDWHALFWGFFHKSQPASDY